MPKFIINVSVMNLYNEPAFRSEVVTQGLLGESNEIIDTSGNWYKVRQWDGYEAWGHGFYGVTHENSYSTSHTFFGHHGQILDQDGHLVRSIHFGSSLNAQGHDGHFHVSLPDGIVGTTHESLSAENLSLSRQSILEMAKSFSGIPYAWGGKSSMGVDCSGFVQSVFKAHGIELPRDSHEQSDHFKDVIDLEQCQLGDLLFFAEEDKISHVAISLGGKELINARGWVRNESLDGSHEDFSQKLKNLFVKAVSIRSIVGD